MIQCIMVKIDNGDISSIIKQLFHWVFKFKPERWTRLVTPWVEIRGGRVRFMSYPFWRL